MRALNLTALILWAGRFLLLILLYAFLFQLYRALLTSPLRGAALQSQPAASIRLVSVGNQGEAWVEAGDQKERRLVEGASVTLGDCPAVGRAVGTRGRVLDTFVSAHHCGTGPRDVSFG